VAAGATLSDAYRQTRDCSHMTTASINANAKKIGRVAAVKARIRELQQGESEESGESHGSGEPSSAPDQVPSETELRVKQERFCLVFIEKGNAAEAYRTVYEVSPDTKPESVHRMAAELLANPKVTSRLDELRAELRKRHEITLNHLVDALRPIAFSDIRKVCDWGSAIPLKDPETGEVIVVQDVIVKACADLDDAAAAMIAKVIRGKDGSVRVELHDKLAAIEKIAKLLGLLKEQHEVKVEEPPRPRHPGQDRLAAMLAPFLGKAPPRPQLRGPDEDDDQYPN
jgi:hypothetical protein